MMVLLFIYLYSWRREREGGSLIPASTALSLVPLVNIKQLIVLVIVDTSIWCRWQLYINAVHIVQLLSARFDPSSQYSVQRPMFTFNIQPKFMVSCIYYTCTESGSTVLNAKCTQYNYLMMHCTYIVHVHTLYICTYIVHMYIHCTYCTYVIH